MAAATHTPGPWKIRWSRDGSGDVGITADGLPNVLAECFADIRASGERASDEAAANARLVATAPELLAALIRAEQTTAELCHGQHPDNECWNVLRQVRAAIAKAKGDS
ncbi:MAG: hypothetical protein J0I08_23495 [Rhizobiales bacterium]|nr:hypothetical protein [Hyphomicrobiales bacterium]